MLSSLLASLGSSSSSDAPAPPKFRRGQPLKCNSDFKNPCIEESDDSVYRYVIFQYEDDSLEVLASSSVEPTQGFTTTLTSGQASLGELLSGLREGKNVFVTKDDSCVFKLTQDKTVEAKELTAIDALSTLTIFHERTRSDEEKRRKVEVLLKKMKKMKRLVENLAPSPRRDSSSSSSRGRRGETSRRERSRSRSPPSDSRKKRRGETSQRDRSRRHRSPSSSSSSSESSATSKDEESAPTRQSRGAPRGAPTSCSFSCGPKSCCAPTQDKAKSKDKSKDKKKKPEPAQEEEDDGPQEISIPFGGGGADLLRMLLMGGLMSRRGPTAATDLPEMEEVD